MNCADCDEKGCYQGRDCTGMGSRVAKRYRASPLDMKISREATFIEGRYYMRYCRLQELIEFCRLMEYRHLGLAFCIGLSSEAKSLQDILKANGYTVSSVCCKVCGIMKDEFGLEKIAPERDEAMCNPVGQAEILNEEGVDLNIGVGLCVGHDVLFIKHSEAPFTPLVIKDRVLAHNPIGAVYSRYYRNLLKGGDQ